MFRKVLIANRGEIAVRIIRTLRDMNIRSVAVYSDADRHALFVEEADEAFRLGPAPASDSYLNGEAIVSVALQAGAQAVHPGYGFLAENAAFAETVAHAGLTFIGPSSSAIRLMGDKAAARASVRPLGVPLVPGTPDTVTSLGEALEAGRALGYPVAVKAAGGGGGRGIRVVTAPDQMSGALEAARREAQAYFKNPEVYLEKYFQDPRHVEIQVLGDSTGRLVHLGERDCSVQRRHQKLIEEAPSPAVTRELRARMGEAAIRAAASAGYTSAGTVEFLLTRDGDFYFLEMNTRIQVEHPVTERITGVDLVREMVLIAAGEQMTVPGNILDPDGHAIEIRVNAEDPARGFRPTPTTITRYQPPGGIGIRLDSGVAAGHVIPPDYDSLLSKLIAWGPDRDTSRRRALRALSEYRIEGPATTIPFSAAVLGDPAFAAGDVGTAFVENHLDELLALLPPSGQSIAAFESPSREEERIFEVEVNRKLFAVRVAELRKPEGKRPARNKRTRTALTSDSTVLLSPMHGTVVGLQRAVGESIEEGEVIFILEAMKMENEVTAHRSGVLASLLVEVGTTVESDQPLATID